jgi:hypothetical protein
MPLIVTDSEVLAQIDADDAQAKGIAARVATLDAAIATNAGAAGGTSAAQWGAIKQNWATWLAKYLAWSVPARADLSGGFFAGAWTGVPQYGNTAVAFMADLNGWQAILDKVSLGAAPTQLSPTPTTPDQAATANATVPIPTLGDSSMALIGLALGVAVLFLLRRK